MKRFLDFLLALRDCIHIYRLGYWLKVLPEGDPPK
jgi:hypothetical protein